MAAMSYVTGTHSFKVGLQHKFGHETTITYGNGNPFVGDVQQLYQVGKAFCRCGLQHAGTAAGPISTTTSGSTFRTLGRSAD